MKKKHIAENKEINPSCKLTSPKKEGLKFSYSSHKKNVDNVKLLISFDVFRADIKKIRDHLNISAGGFSDDKAMEWEKITDKHADEIMRSEEYNLQLLNTAKKVLLEEISLNMGNKQVKLLSQKMFHNYLDNAVNFLIEKFNIPSHYEQTIRHYILLNETMFVPAKNYSVGSYDSNENYKNVRYLPIKIFAKMTDNDLEEIKKTIKRFGKNLPDFQPLKDIDERLTIEDWMKNKKTSNDSITRAEYSMTAGEIAENIFGSKKYTNKVRDNQRTLDNLRKNRFGKS